jgi:hypothetical protein
MIAQRSTRVVLTNSSSSKKITVLYVKRLSTDADEMLSDYTLDKKLTITTSPTALTAVSFTPYKNAYPGDTGTRPDETDTDSSTNFSVCYGAGSDKYTIMVDASSNIVTSKMGRVHEFTKRHWLNRSAGSIDVVSNRGAWIHCDADDRS